MSRWWKCDLQVASPGAAGFHGPSVDPWNFESEEARRSAASRYMAHARAAGLEVVALADHNDASWIEPMRAAGEAEGIAVFPGVEVTTGSGADGIHIIIIGQRGASTADFDDVLSRVCGFGGDHPRFDPVHRTPASSPRTLLQILDALSDEYLVIAPHAFNDNGIASANTVKGDLRWKALHHERLGAIDVGDVRAIHDPASWHGRFARRELADFPCIDRLAFVSTSDAYSLDRLGARYTWIRMSHPTLEALRQAFLDHEVRIACDWDELHPAGQAPNDVGHAWVGRVSLRGLTTTPDELLLDFAPGLTVIVGGRGSGKSSVVAALRLLYGDVDGLPNQARTEFEELRQAVFDGATLEAEHYLSHSGERQTAVWTPDGGPKTLRTSAVGESSGSTETDFKVRVINQKELFERAAHSAADPTSTSRNLLNLVDDALASGSSGRGGPAAFDEALYEAQTSWISAALAYQAEVDATAQRPVVVARIEELQRQVAAFDDPANKSRRERNDLTLEQEAWLNSQANALADAFERLRRDLDAAVPAEIAPAPSGIGVGVADDDFEAATDRVMTVRRELRERITEALASGESALQESRADQERGPWREAVTEAAEDGARYREELAALGVDPDEYDRVRQRLVDESDALERIDERRARLGDLEEAAVAAWRAIEAMVAARRTRRQGLLAGVEERSALLRFDVTAHSDVGDWTRRVRDLLSLRADGFLPDVPALGNWLWNADSEDESTRRQERWRAACITGDFASVAAEASLRPQWQQRLSDLDAVVRARLGSMIADDVVQMEFLIEGGKPEVAGDWKPLTAGSPGQRSAAMLSFVMHHGIDPLVLDQPEDDLDTEWITQLVVTQLRTSRWTRQLIVVTHNANIPVNADAERIIVLENHAGGIRVRRTAGPDGQDSLHVGALEDPLVRQDVQQIMEGGVVAFVRRERRYNNELNTYRAALRSLVEDG